MHMILVPEFEADVNLATTKNKVTAKDLSLLVAIYYHMDDGSV